MVDEVRGAVKYPLRRIVGSFMDVENYNYFRRFGGFLLAFSVIGVVHELLSLLQNAS